MSFALKSSAIFSRQSGLSRTYIPLNSNILIIQERRFLCRKRQLVGKTLHGWSIIGSAEEFGNRFFEYRVYFEVVDICLKVSAQTYGVQKRMRHGEHFGINNLIVVEKNIEVDSARLVAFGLRHTLSPEFLFYLQELY